MTSRLRKQLEPATRTMLSVASPRHRRWQHTLAACTLDPSAVEAADAPGPRDVVICGCPRSGTALLTAALHQPPVMCTVMEPWDGLRLAPGALFASLRGELEQGRMQRGRLRVDRLLADGAVEWQRDGERSFPVDARPDTLLGVKWPSYWQLLGRLPTTRFLVCVRDPAEVVQSFAATGGRLAEGFEYDTAFTGALNRQLEREHPDAESRRLGMYDAVYSHVLSHLAQPNVLAVRYERWFSEPTAVLEEVGAFLGADLRATKVRVRPPAARPDPGLAAAIRSRSRTAAQLGYR